MHRTRGLWLTMFTRLLGGLLVLVMIGWFIVLIAGSVGLFSMKLGLLLWFCGFIFMIAFALAYLTIIAATVG